MKTLTKTKNSFKLCINFEPKFKEKTKNSFTLRLLCESQNFVRNKLLPSILHINCIFLCNLFRWYDYFSYLCPINEPQRWVSH